MLEFRLFLVVFEIGLIELKCIKIYRFVEAGGCSILLTLALEYLEC